MFFIREPYLTISLQSTDYIQAATSLACVLNDALLNEMSIKDVMSYDNGLLTIIIYTKWFEILFVCSISMPQNAVCFEN